MLEQSNCDTVVHQLLEVEAQVTVTPHIKHGKPKTSCIESDIFPCSDSKTSNDENFETSTRKCCFTVTQVICVEIPITFDVEVDVDKGKVHCCKPNFGPCELTELSEHSISSKLHEFKEPAKPYELKKSAEPSSVINLRYLRTN